MALGTNLSVKQLLCINGKGSNKAAVASAAAASICSPNPGRGEKQQAQAQVCRGRLLDEVCNASSVRDEVGFENRRQKSQFKQTPKDNE